jgi:integrase
MRLMRNVLRRGETWYVRVAIPDRARHLFGGKREHWESLKTEDELVAIERAAPVIARIKRIIANSAKDPRAAISPDEHKAQQIDPGHAWAAMIRWFQSECEQARVDAFNGALGAPDGPEDLEELVILDRLGSDPEPTGDGIPGFDDMLFRALGSQGIALSSGHPAIQRLRPMFARNLLGVLEGRQVLRRADAVEFWTSPAPPSLEPPEAPVSIESREGKPGRMKVSDLLERFISLEQPNPKDESEMRGYVRHLISAIGDRPVRDVAIKDFDDFLLKLRRFPVTKRPDILSLPFNDIIEKFGVDPDLPGPYKALANKTIRTKWFGSYNRLFKFAVVKQEVGFNPVTSSIPSKSLDEPVERKAWTAGQIQEIFASPLFTGSENLRGPRSKPGPLISKDARYWLPIVGLWSGMRLDEIGTLSSAELRLEAGVWVFDLTKRPLKGPRRVKTPGSRRLIPVHSRLKQLGFLQYAGEQTEWLFPDLRHDGLKPSDTTAAFSKWFGRWRRENGFHSDEMQDFHSFRGTFIEACREAEVEEEIRDRLTGHDGHPSKRVSRKYGGVSVGLLARNMEKVQFSTFMLTA